MVGDDTPDATDSAFHELFHADEPVPFVYWRQFTGAKTSVLFVAATAAIAFITGLSHLSQGSFVAAGPLAGLLPPGTGDAIRLTGIVSAFALAIAAAGMQRRKRLALRVATVVLVLGILTPLVTAQATDVLLLALSTTSLLLVVRNRHAFDKPMELTAFQVAALVSFVAVQAYGTVGVYVLREQYQGIENWTDAFYYIVVTGTTVGYGDATPITEQAKLFTLSVLIIGTAAFAVAFGAILVPALESRISTAFGTMTTDELTLLEDHVVVLGHGSLTEPLIDEIADETDVVVLTGDTDPVSDVPDDVLVVTGDPTDSATIVEMRLAAARGVVVAMETDAETMMAVLAVRQVDPDVRVVAAALDAGNVDKLEAVGADAVVSPAVIGGQLLGQSVLEDA